MGKMTLIFADMQVALPEKPRFCPRCGSPYLSGHGTFRREIKDPTIASFPIERYRCSTCGVTFRNTPEGVEGSRRYSKSVVNLAVTLRAFGLSSHAVARLLRDSNLPKISPVTVWRLATKGLGKLKSRGASTVQLVTGEEPEVGGWVVALRVTTIPGSIKAEIWHRNKISEELRNFLTNSSVEIEEEE